MSSNKVDCLWSYLKNHVLTLDQSSPRADRDRAVSVTAGVCV